MFNPNKKLSPGRKRLVVALLAIVGLSVIGTLIYNDLAEDKKARIAASVPVTNTTPVAAPADAVPIEGITDVSVVETPQEEQKPVVQKVTRRKARASSRKQVAMRFPAPPIDGAKVSNTPNPESLVEVWEADKKTVIAVPPGSKFED